MVPQHKERYVEEQGMHESVNCFLLEIFAAVWASHVHVIQIPRRGEDV
jgi:hypothetical protein